MFSLNITEAMAPWQYGFQIPATPVMEGIINFHHDLFYFLTIIIIFVFYILYRCVIQFNIDENKQPIIVTHAPILEIVWTIIPALILVLIAIPSFSLLYSIDEIITPLLTIKIIGHQWYWSYEYLDADYYFNDLLFVDAIKDLKDWFKEEDKDMTIMYDSYMLSMDMLKYKEQRLLAVDNKLYVPVESNVRLLVTSADVLHSWAVPALGIKLDACPGRLNQTSLFVKRPGTFYGQCSEICGINHGFMPIAVTALDVFGNFSDIHLAQVDGINTLFRISVKNKVS